LKILLISPVTDPKIKIPTGLMIPQLALHLLEGLTPSQHQVKIIEEEVDSINLDEECDLVGISCMTANAPRAYELAKEFKKRGKKVVLGGVHPTLLFDEAIQYADSVVVGEAENVWEQLLEDFQNDNLQKKYHHPSVPLDRYIPVKYKKHKRFSFFDIIPIMTTRGCPYNCDFCCVSNLYGKEIRHSPVENVVRAIKESKRKYIIFLDDNIIGNPNYSKALFKAITPLKIKWVGQASILFVHDDELMKLAKNSGCTALFFGVESISVNQLEKMRKSIKDINKLEQAIKKVRDIGIHFHASLVFGFDTDTKETFPETLDFLQRNKIGTVSFNILTPYPGTRVYEHIKSENRLLTTDWKYYDHSTVVFKPKNMTPYELQKGCMWVKEKFSKVSSILKRFPGNLSHPLLYLFINSGIKKNVAMDKKKLPTLMSGLFKDK
jgi:radical SAM superfamily enzyme YgiQ (UPF0313 family)